MSIDVDWHKLTSGPDGEALAESVRDFIDEKFQTVSLPKFIRLVKVLSFHFGSVTPELEIKDVCDPLPDFYEGNEDDGYSDEDDDADDDDDATPKTEAADLQRQPTTLHSDRGAHPTQSNTDRVPSSRAINGAMRRESLRLDTAGTATGPGQMQVSPADSQHPMFERSSTPGIPGGTSNLSYFHLPLSAGFGASSPFMGGPNFPNSQRPDATLRGRLGAEGYRSRQASTPQADEHAPRYGPGPRIASDIRPVHHQQQQHNLPGELASSADPLRAQTASPSLGSSIPDRDPNDVQVVARLKYNGDIQISLSADILLDYPMPSFVGIPLRLNVTGLAFDGVAILAYIRHKAHFCFLSPEDADALVGREDESQTTAQDAGETARQSLAASTSKERDPNTKRIKGLFEEIQVESEIGQKGDGKQSLKNVGKVEKFVLEQVRNIFENEFVYPSFWTFLV